MDERTLAQETFQVSFADAKTMPSNRKVGSNSIQATAAKIHFREEQVTAPTPGPNDSGPFLQDCPAYQI